MLLILVIILVLLQVGAYKLANKVKMTRPYLKVLIVFLILDFSFYPYLFDITRPGESRPGFELTDSNYLVRSFLTGAAIIVITHVICLNNDKDKNNKSNRGDL
ncbi:MAG: hypothetical protein HY062_17335 [Bacteroidetes bacterium]|nr:hypothetical protein [Bacteroidota bacterium]